MKLLAGAGGGEVILVNFRKVGPPSSELKLNVTAINSKCQCHMNTTLDKVEYL